MHLLLSRHDAKLQFSSKLKHVCLYETKNAVKWFADPVVIHGIIVEERVGFVDEDLRLSIKIRKDRYHFLQQQVNLPVLVSKSVSKREEHLLLLVKNGLFRRLFPKLHALAVLDWNH